MGNEPHTLGSERRCSGEGTSPPRHHSSCRGAQRGQWRRHHEAPVRRGAFIPGRVAAIGRKIAAALEGMLGPDRYFYDNNYKAQLARPSLDVLLQDIYRNRSKLIVVFVGSDYRRKEWCGIELRAIREILLERGYERIMFVRLDDGEVEGVFRTDGYVDARHHSPSEIAHFIQHRVALLRDARVRHLRGRRRSERGYATAWVRGTRAARACLFGRVTISTSLSRRRMQRRSRSRENLCTRPLTSAETSGCLSPSSSAALACVRRRRLSRSRISRTSCALRSSSSGLAKPRSAKTLPLPRVTAISSVMAWPLPVIRLVVLPGPLETVPDHLKLMLWGRDALLGFLLEGMKDIQDAREAHGVYGSVGVAVEIVDGFQHAPPTKPFQGLGGRVLAAQFRVVDRLADHTADLVRKFPEVVLR